MKANPTPKMLRRLLSYDPETGLLHWRIRTHDLFTDGKYTAKRCCARWNGKHAGKEAFLYITPYGYRVGGLFGKLHMAHRVIWAHVTDIWPVHDIDHNNRDRSDNRISNLRESTRSQNLCNRVSKPTSSSKYLGVSWNTEKARWVAQIKVAGKTKFLGRFKDEVDAALSYDAAARKHHLEFAAPNFDAWGNEADE